MYWCHIFAISKYRLHLLSIYLYSINKLSFGFRFQNVTLRLNGPHVISLSENFLEAPLLEINNYVLFVQKSSPH